MDSIEFLTCLRSARRGAAAGPSGMTPDNLFPVLENEGDSEFLCRVASLLSVGQVPETILEAIRLGRMKALSKLDEGVRGIVDWRCLAEISGKDDREASHREGGSSHSSLPVRPVHQSRM